MGMFELYNNWYVFLTFVHHYNNCPKCTKLYLLCIIDILLFVHRYNMILKIIFDSSSLRKAVNLKHYWNCLLFLSQRAPFQFWDVENIAYRVKKYFLNPISIISFSFLHAWRIWPCMTTIDRLLIQLLLCPESILRWSFIDTSFCGTLYLEYACIIGLTKKLLSEYFVNWNILRWANRFILIPNFLMLSDLKHQQYSVST